MKHAGVLLSLLLLPFTLQGQATNAQLLSGQELIFRGRFGAAQLYFSDLVQTYPKDASGPTLEAAALIWWSNARNEDGFQAVAIDSLLTEGVRRAQAAIDSAADDGQRRDGYYWLGTAYGYRARQADVRGNTWRAARDAKVMQSSYERAFSLDSTCADCLSGLGVYDYEMARAGALARLVARIIGLGGGDAERGLVRVRRASEEGVLTRTEARWVYANMLLREGPRDPALREEGMRILGDLAARFPDNPVFQRAITQATATP